MNKPLPPVSLNSADVAIVSREVVYQGFFRMEKLQLRHRLFEGGWSPVLSRECFVRGQAVAAVMYDPQHQLIGLVEQFRVGALAQPGGPWLYEVVAGMTKSDEQPEQVIHRELAEEAAMVPSRLIPICDYLSSPGGTDEQLHLYCAVGNLQNLGGIHGLVEEGENIKVVALPEETVFAQLYSGRFNNAATLICLQWLLLHRENLTA